MELRKNRLRVDEIPMTSLQDTEQIHAIKQMRKEGMFFKNQVGQACCPLLPRDSAENSMGKWIKFGAFLEEMGLKNWMVQGDGRGNWGIEDEVGSSRSRVGLQAS